MSKDVNNIHGELLDNVSDTYQKSEGFPTWDILRAVAFGLKSLWAKVFYVESLQNVDNLTGELLERFVGQRKGLYRKEATCSVGTITVKTGEGVITAGDLFSTKGGVRFEALETVDCSAGSVVAVRALEAGSAGNVPVGAICQIPVTITGIVEIYNDDATVDGYEAETDDDLRERYYEAIREPATSGNVYHYKRWAKEVAGVQNAKVFSLWAGDNTVQVVIIDDNAQPASEELVGRVQAYIDPNSAGTGAGQAPVGAYCTVTSAEALNINITASIVTSGDVESITALITDRVRAYLSSIAFNEDYVSVAKISDAILNTEGVADIDAVTVNGVTTRIAIPVKSVAILGEVVINAL